MVVSSTCFPIVYIILIEVRRVDSNFWCFRRSFPFQFVRKKNNFKGTNLNFKVNQLDHAVLRSVDHFFMGLIKQLILTGKEIKGLNLYSWVPPVIYFRGPHYNLLLFNSCQKNSLNLKKEKCKSSNLQLLIITIVQMKQRRTSTNHSCPSKRIISEATTQLAPHVPLEDWKLRTLLTKHQNIYTFRLPRNVSTGIIYI